MRFACLSGRLDTTLDSGDQGFHSIIRFKCAGRRSDTTVGETLPTMLPGNHARPGADAELRRSSGPAGSLDDDCCPTSSRRGRHPRNGSQRHDADRRLHGSTSSHGFGPGPGSPPGLAPRRDISPGTSRRVGGDTARRRPPPGTRWLVRETSPREAVESNRGDL